jgi:hypothetical protein
LFREAVIESRAKTVEALRAEILEAERSRSDLLKWKLVLVAALGAVGIGVNTENHRLPLVLVGIPLVCAYVDLLCRHLTLRVHVIAEFLRGRQSRDAPDETRSEEDTFRAYESYAHANEDAFSLENWALFGSSALISCAVAAYGVVLALRQDPSWWGAAVAVSGVAGLVLTAVIEYVFEQRKETIRASLRRGPILRLLERIVPRPTA